MIKRDDIIGILKTVNIEKLESDGPTSVFFSIENGRGAKTFALSIQKDFIIVTIGKFLFKRKFRIHKSEL